MRVDEIEFSKSAYTTAGLVRDGRPEIAFVGRSNVGKSSLLNRLVGRRKIANVSSHPGRTRGINYYLVNRSFYFVDFPGYGYAKVGKSLRREWARLTTTYFERAAQNALVVQIVDAKVGATELDSEACRFFRHVGARIAVVATKVDKVRRSQRDRQIRQIRAALQIGAEEDAIEFSAVSGEGTRDLWKRIHDHLANQSDRVSEVDHVKGNRKRS